MSVRPARPAMLARRARAGFTLIEMLVVLAILAALSLVALRSTAGLADRGRYEATQRALAAVEAAILGSKDGLPTSVVAGGFLADCGRLPNFSAADPTQRLTELWQQPEGMSANALVADAVDPDVVLSCGWRGPYLRLPIGVNGDATGQILDGFARPLAVRPGGLGRWQILSPGADGLLDQGVEYDADVAITLPAGIETASVSGTVAVLQALPAGGPWQVHVFAYSPDPASGGLRVQEEDVDGDPPVDSASATPPIVFHYTFQGANSLTPGPRALRAYLFPDNSATPRIDAIRESRIFNVTLLHGAQTFELSIDS